MAFHRLCEQSLIHPYPFVVPIESGEAMSTTDPANGSPEIPFMSREEQLALYRIKVERELQERVISWAQLRLAVVATVISLLVGGGVFYSINNQIRDVVQSETKREIETMASTRQRALLDLEQINLKSREIDRFIEDTRAELRRTRNEANDVAQQVKETYPAVRDMVSSMAKLKTDVDRERDRAKQDSFLFSQYYQEQQFRAKSDRNEMRANIDLLERGFAILEDLAATIGQKDPKSELARQFAAFSNRWEEARAVYQQRLADLKRRRAMKVIHYSRPDASAEREANSRRVITALQESGFTVDEWLLPNDMTEFKAAEHVAGEFGVADPRLLLRAAFIAHPQAKASYDDIKRILEPAKLAVPPAYFLELAPKKRDILQSGGTFKIENIILISDFGR
jgi:hypothetical protein